MNESIKSYSERARLAREAKDRHTLDPAVKCQCSCGDIHWKKKEVEKVGEGKK
jgi:hypothetical protein